MDYEQKYKDVLEKLRDFYRDYDTVSHLIDVKEELANLFPELKESEDEKIRKDIIWCLKHSGIKEGNPINPHVTTIIKDAIAWLEKQGEKPRYSIGDVLCDKSCTTLNKDAQPNFEIIDIRDGMYICDKGSFPISQQDEYELVAKKIEQKPTNEEMIETLRTEYEKGRADVIAEMQVAWSEEDEEIIKNIISVLDWDGTTGKKGNPYQNEIDWLYSLKNRVQPKQEWSEEDNHYLCGLIGLIEQSKAELPITLKGKAADNCIEWLKSLKNRCTWKPIEEQMKALHDLNLTGGISYAGQGQELINLYNDLNKLKE